VGDHGPLIAGLLLALVPRLVFHGNGERRKLVAALTWIAAAAVLLLRAVRTAPNDDEVFYLAQSWATRIGDTAGDLPMRSLIFRPLLLPPWPPSAVLVAGRAVTVIATVLSALLVPRLVRRAGAHPADAALAGALTLVWLANAADGVVIRPEVFANAGIMLAITLLIAPPARWRAGPATGAAFLALTLAASISHRRLALVPVALGVWLWSMRGRPARAELAWAAGGVTAGLLPSFLYIAWADSFASVWYWNWTFVMRHSWARRGGLWIRFPVAPLLVGAAGTAAALLGRRERGPVAPKLAVFWLASTALAIVVPFTLPYALGLWFALSVALAAWLASRFLPSPASPAGQRVYAAAVGVLGLTPLLGRGVVRLVRSPPPVRSELALIDWLHESADGGKVACVAPYHPIKAANAWRLWNAWWYCYLRDPAFNRELNPGLGDMLRSDGARIIEWDPWPEASGYRNVLAYAVANGFLSRREAQAVSLGLRKDYRLVRWNGPLPPRFGGGRFLVLRNRPLDARVVVLPDERIAP
jgi:hypothetical protein